MIQKIFLAVNNCQQLVNNYFFLSKMTKNDSKKVKGGQVGSYFFFL